MTSKAPVLCVSCTHNNEDGTCTAFPERIPSIIVKFGADHTVPFPGDRGIQYQMKNSDQAQAKFVQWQQTFGK